MTCSWRKYSWKTVYKKKNETKKKRQVWVVKTIFMDCMATMLQWVFERETLEGMESFQREREREREKEREDNKYTKKMMNLSMMKIQVKKKKKSSCFLFFLECVRQIEWMECLFFIFCRLLNKTNFLNLTDRREDDNSINKIKSLKSLN